MFQHSNFLQTFTVKHSYIILKKHQNPKRSFPTQLWNSRFVIINDRHINSPWKGRFSLSIFTWSKQSMWLENWYFAWASFRMKSGVEVKQQLIKKHSIFMYFPCFLNFRKSVQLSCYSACGITDIFAIYWRTITFFNHNLSSENRMSLLFSSAMLLNMT